MEMRLRWGLAALLALSGRAPGAPDDAVTYWLLASYEGDRWCGYTDEGRFRKDLAAGASPVVETARVTYEGGRLAQLVYRVAAESGDWVLVDELTPSGDDVKVRRTTTFDEGPYIVVKEATIHAGKPGPLTVTSITGPDGTPAQPGADVDVNYPPHALLAVQRMPFMQVVSAMRSQTSAFLCRKVQQRASAGR
jgi:hypothetical protein